MGCALAHETGDSLGNELMLLRPCAALNEHLQIQFLRGESLERILADRTETLFTYISKHTLFQIRFAEVAGIVIAKGTFYLSR